MPEIQRSPTAQNFDDAASLSLENFLHGVHFSHCLILPWMPAARLSTCHQSFTPLSGCEHPLRDFLAVDAPFSCYLGPDRHSFEGLVATTSPVSLVTSLSLLCFGADTRYETFQTVTPFFCLSRPASLSLYPSQCGCHTTSSLRRSRCRRSQVFSLVFL
jgi:hypothetical protein